MLCWCGFRENLRLCFVDVISETNHVCALLCFQTELTFVLCWRDFRENSRLCFVVMISENSRLYCVGLNSERTTHISSLLPGLFLSRFCLLLWENSCLCFVVVISE